MKVSGKMLVREVFVGKTAVYLTGIDLDTMGDIKFSVEKLPASVVVGVTVGFDGDVKGRIWDNQMQMGFEDGNVRLEVVKPAAGKE